MNYKISNGRLLIDNGEKIAVRPGDLYIRDRKISFVPFSEEETFETVDAENRLVMPGLINMHTHAYMTIMRNYADDVPFTDWLFKGVMPVEDRLPAEDARWASLLGFIEMIRKGTT